MPTEVHGDVHEGWGKVADAFRDNFHEGRELGASCCVYADGVPVVNLWGGLADRRTGRPWEKDTVAVVFSASKGATALCAHRLVERGELELDAPVVRYWPEFGASGKDAVIVRWLLSHQAGLPAVETPPLTLEEACDWETVIHLLEAQTPLWEPGKQHMYHGETFGHLVGEVVRRVTGKTVGRFFADEIAGPLGLSAWIGLPEAIEPQVAHLEIEPRSAPTPTGNASAPAATGTASARGPLGGAFPPENISEHGGFNARMARAAEIPSANLITNAHSMARMYAATIGSVDGVLLLKPETVEVMRSVQTRNSTPFWVPPGIDPNIFQFTLGFVAPMWGPRSFGSVGLGGSQGFADPDAGVSFGYVMNHMVQGGMAGDPRTGTLLTALSACAS